MKANKAEESVLVTEHISRVVLSIKDGNGADIDPDYVANVVESRIDIHQVAPHLTRHLAILELKQQIRSYLRKNHDPVEVMTAKVESGQEDMFDDILQDHYPVKRNILGTVKRIYARRDTLTEEEMEINSSRMERVSDGLAKHAEALRAWFYSK